MLNEYQETVVILNVNIQRGGGGSVLDPPPPENHKNIGFLSNIGRDALKNHKATKPAFNVGLSTIMA